MARRSHRLERIAVLAIGVLAMASVAPAWADHQVYPPGWNKPATATAPVLYQFIAGGSRLHRMPPGTTALASPGNSAGQSQGSSGNSAQPQ